MVDNRDLAARVAKALAEAAKAEEATTMSHLADLAGDDESTRTWADRAAKILDAMSTVDLGLVIVAGYNDRAFEKAQLLWSQLCTLRPKDVTP